MIKTLVLRLENRPSLRKCRFMDYMVNKRFSFAVLEITGTLAGAIFLDVCRNAESSNAGLIFDADYKLRPTLYFCAIGDTTILRFIRIFPFETAN